MIHNHILFLFILNINYLKSFTYTFSIILIFLFLTKINIMNFLNQTTSINPKNIIIKFMSSKKNKCQCGKTKDSTGNCDGSHANK